MFGSEANDKGAVHGFLGAPVGIIVIAVIILTSCNTNRQAISQFNRHALNAPYDAIIVPGIAYNGEHSNGLLKARVYWAKELFERGITRNIIFSGAAVHSPYVEGQIMKIIADSLGIPSYHTFVEKRAIHSNENLEYGLQLAHQLGFKKVALATDLRQTRFIKFFSYHIMKHMPVLPLNEDSIRPYKRPLPEINAQAAYVSNFVPIEQR